MKVARFKKTMYLVYRLISAILDPMKLLMGLYGYLWFFRDLFKYRSQNPKFKVSWSNLYPVLNEKVSFTRFDPHYFFQEPWAFEKILARRPGSHVDVGSAYVLSGYLSKITKAVFVDLRPIDTKLKNLEIMRGDILNLPFKDCSVQSLSCLHVAEHIGLGRYGDKLDPDGTQKACEELARVLAVDGFLYFSLPIGRERLCFNAHRVHSPTTILNYFEGLTLVQFSVVDDDGAFHEDVLPEDFEDLEYGDGLFMFTQTRPN